MPSNNDENLSTKAFIAEPLLFIKASATEPVEQIDFGFPGIARKIVTIF